MLPTPPEQQNHARRHCSQAARWIDLHLHTTHSDGRFSPQQIVAMAVQCGLSAIAVTDHDTVGAVQETQALAERHGIECVSGIELSAYSELDGDIHLLGYFLDPTNPSLLRTLQRVQSARTSRILSMIGRLQALGFELSYEAVRKTARANAVLGRPHLARALVRQGCVASVDEAFKRFLRPGKPAYLPKTTLSYQEAIETILQAGGIPVYAHPGLTKKDALIPKLLSMGLRGLEVLHSEHTAQDIRRYQAMVKDNNLVATGGSDCHGGGEGWEPLIGTVRVPFALLERLRQSL